MIYIRSSCNLKYLSIKNPYEVIYCRDALDKTEVFNIVHLENDTVSIRSFAGKYLSLKVQNKNVLIADADTISSTEKFLLQVLEEGDNRFTLRACNGKFVSVMDNKNQLLAAGSVTESVRETFRLYILHRTR